jgi:hypothetical protein
VSNQSILRLFWVAMFCMGPSSAVAASNPLEVKWNELAALIAGHRVELVLLEGRQVRGEAIAVRESALLMDVKDSDANGYPKGNAAVPRASINVIKLERSRGTWGRSMGTVLGVLTGASVGGYVAATTAQSAGAAIPIFVGIASATSLAGYYTGRQLDRRFTMIKVVP